MSTYTDELQAEVERVTLRGNADKNTIRKLASIIFRMDQRIRVLEGEIVVDDKPAAPPVFEEPPKKSSGKTMQPLQKKSSASKQPVQTQTDETSEA